MPSPRSTPWLPASSPLPLPPRNVSRQRVLEPLPFDRMDRAQVPESPARCALRADQEPGTCPPFFWASSVRGERESVALLRCRGPARNHQDCRHDQTTRFSWSFFTSVATSDLHARRRAGGPPPARPSPGESTPAPGGRAPHGLLLAFMMLGRLRTGDVEAQITVTIAEAAPQD